LPGDIVVLKEPYGAMKDASGNVTYVGHTGVVVTADVHTVTLFQQNDPLQSTPHQASYGYTAVKGWIHVLTAPQQATPSIAPVDAHGLDLRNSQSLQTALDIWYAVANGKYVSIETYNTLQQQIKD